MEKRLIFVHALSPLHAGTGQGVGVIDLPIAKEKATGLPYLPGSSLKGTLRDEFNDESQKDLRNKIFGPEKDRASEHAGAIQFTDQTLLLLPVRSLAGTFAWVTSPYILRRLKRDATDAGANALPADIPEPGGESHCEVHSKDNGMDVTKLIVSGVNKVCLEDLDLEPTESTSVKDWADWLKGRVFPASSPWQEMLGKRLCVVHDDVLSFILNTATEITARVKIQDDAKTVQSGGLWYEEALPTESVLFGLALAFPNDKTVINGQKLTPQKIFEEVGKKLDKTLQFGGKATVGRGICHVSMSNGAAPNGG
ncbi:MAG: type III-B CRISPR module RAMP protein Cmr4 [Pyrinomonadaceae bacterium]